MDGNDDDVVGEDNSIIDFLFFFDFR
jgi:hypothetical protein